MAQQGSLCTAIQELSRNESADTVRKAAEAALRLTEALEDLSGCLIAILDRMDGDIDLEDGHDREEDGERPFLPLYGIDQSQPPLGFKDMRKAATV